MLYVSSSFCELLKVCLKIADVSICNSSLEEVIGSLCVPFSYLGRPWYEWGSPYQLPAITFITCWKEYDK